ncbi:MAG: hypothetical protein JSS27_06095 [Planctomycetes bacterium]|nr:hypothetical protein [Planctomycetota bacterium]
MHARELIELAAFLTTQGDWLVANPDRLTDAAHLRYTRASRARLERWNHSFDAWSREGVHDLERSELLSSCEELITSDVLLRVWSTLVVTVARTRPGTERERETQDLFHAHQLAAQQVYAALLDESLVASHDALSLNRLRRRVEGWADVLVGHLISVGCVDLFAPHRDRAIEFSREARNQSEQEPQAWRLVLASLRLAFRPAAGRAPHAALNAEIAAAIVSVFESHLLASNPSFASLGHSLAGDLDTSASATISDDGWPVIDASQAFLMTGRWDSLRP